MNVFLYVYFAILVLILVIELSIFIVNNYRSAKKGRKDLQWILENKAEFTTSLFTTSLLKQE